MKLLEWFKAWLFSGSPQESSKAGYIVIPRSVVDELPDRARERADDMLSDLTGRARLKHPDHWYQVILRESNGKFKKHPHHENAVNDKLF